MALAGKRFISNGGPNQAPSDVDREVLFVTSTATYADAVVEKSRIDSTASADRATVIYQSYMKGKLRWTSLVPDGALPDGSSPIGFDVFSVPRALLAPGADLRAQVAGLLRDFSQEKDPGNV